MPSGFSSERAVGLENFAANHIKNFRESRGESSVAPYQLPKISSLRGSLWVPETLLSRSGAKFLCIETDNEVNADLLAFIKEAIIAIRGRLQAWSTRGERHD